MLNPDAFERLALHPGAGGAGPLTPTNIIRGIPGQDYHGGLMARLEQRAGGPCVLPNAALRESRCILFPWDWRLDLGRLSPAEIERPRAGIDYAALMYRAEDGWVTRASALGWEEETAVQQRPFAVRNVVLGCAGHTEAATDTTVRQTLVGDLWLADAAERMVTA
jgi:hypothetical protein